MTPKSALQCLSMLATVVSVVFASSAATAEPLTLEEARDEARAANEDVSIAEERVRVAEGLRRQVLAGLLPSLSGTLSGSYSGPEVEIGGRAFTRTFDWSANISASARLLDLSLYPAYSAAGDRVDLSGREAEWVERTVVFQTEQAYWELAAAERSVSIAESTVQLRTAYLEQAEALAEQGIALPLDAARARAQKLEADQALVEATATLGNAADRLAILLARPTDGTLRTSQDATTAPPPPPEAEGTPQGRPDLEALDLAVSAGEDDYDSVFWSFFPFITLTGNTRFGQPSLAAPDGLQWSVVLALNWTLYDGGRRFGQLEQRSAELQIAELQLTRAERDARAELTQALRDWRAAFEAVAVAEELKKVATEAYDMAKARFDAGLATSIEVNESSDSLLRAELQLNNALLAVDTAASRYRYLRGIAENSEETRTTENR